MVLRRGSTRYNPHNLIKFNWDMEIGRTQNTFSLNLLGLRQIYFLSEAYRIEPNIHYLELADDFVKYFLNPLEKIELKMVCCIMTMRLLSVRKI